MLRGAQGSVAALAGLGKTTVAHVIARHCGFRAVEINASDERTATSLTSRINDAVQMQAVMGDKRPNCVVIDEIDGATGMPPPRYNLNIGRPSSRINLEQHLIIICTSQALPDPIDRLVRL